MKKVKPSGNVHALNVSIATAIGLKESILLQHFYYWYQNNQGKSNYEHDGHIWTYNTVSSLNSMFTYLTPREIQTAIAKLIKLEFVITGNYNKMGYDRTKWYAVTQLGIDLMEGKDSEVNSPFISQNVKSISQNVKSISQNVKSISQNVNTIPNIDSNIDSYTEKNIEHLDTLEAQECLVNIQVLSIDDFNDQESNTKQEMNIQQDINLDSIFEAEQYIKVETKQAKPTKIDIQQDIDLEDQDPIVTYDHNNQACYKAKAKVNDLNLNKDIEKDILIPVIDLPYLTKDNLGHKLHNYKMDINKVMYQEANQLIRDLAIMFSNNVYSKFYA
jgi:hypothetical protein